MASGKPISLICINLCMKGYQNIPKGLSYGHFHLLTTYGWTDSWSDNSCFFLFLDDVLQPSQHY